MARATSTRWTSIGEAPATTAAGCPAAAGLGEHPGPQLGGGRDSLTTAAANSPAATAGPAPGGRRRDWRRVGGDGGGVLGVVGVERVGGQVVR